MCASHDAKSTFFPLPHFHQKPAAVLSRFKAAASPPWRFLSKSLGRSFLVAAGYSGGWAAAGVGGRANHSVPSEPATGKIGSDFKLASWLCLRSGAGGDR